MAIKGVHEWPVEQVVESPVLFEVTFKTLVGQVRLGDGDLGLSPQDAAFVMISRFAVDGEYQFPHVDGDRVITVTVNTGKASA